MTKYSETNTIKENGHATDAMNNSDFEIDHITPLSKRNLAIFCAFKENLKRGIFPPIKVNYDEKYGFYVEAIRAIPKHTLITEYVSINVPYCLRSMTYIYSRAQAYLLFFSDW